MDQLSNDLIFINMLRRMSDNCRTKRIEKGWSPLDLAANANVAIQTVYNVENKTGNITIRTMVNLSSALEIKFEDFIK